MARDKGSEQSTATHELDKYRDLRQVVTAMLDDAEIPKEGVDRVEIECLPGGDAVYRVWGARADDFIGGYLPPA